MQPSQERGENTGGERDLQSRETSGDRSRRACSCRERRRPNVTAARAMAATRATSSGYRAANGEAGLRATRFHVAGDHGDNVPRYDMSSGDLMIVAAVTFIGAKESFRDDPPLNLDRRRRRKRA